MKKLNVLFVFIFFLLVSMFLTLPASFVLKQIKLDENIEIGAVQGPWWSFNVDWISYKGFTQVNNQVILNPSCFITAAVCYDVNNDNAKLSFNKSLLNDILVLENSYFNIDFIDLNSFLTNLLVKPTGSLEIKIDSLNLNQQALLGLKGDIFWHSIGVEGESFNLGSIQASVKHQTKQIILTLSDQSKKLDLKGYVKMSNEGLIDSNVQLKTLNSFPSAVKTIVQSVMKQRGPNVFEYKSKLSNRAIKGLKLNF